MRPTLIALALASLCACHSHHDHDSGPAPVPVFVETERNDDPLTANDFGVLHLGDHFFIDGFVRDDLADPFDSFLFTSAEALHVDFQLFIGNAAADLDVCLYDPAIDQTVACFATSNDPEQGGVDVFGGGLDFQLVVESFVGDATYSLEIVVLPFFPALAERESLAAAGASGLRGVGARAEHEVDAPLHYHAKGPENSNDEPAPRPLVELEQTIEVDEEHGTVLEIVRIHRFDE